MLANHRTTIPTSERPTGRSAMKMPVVCASGVLTAAGLHHAKSPCDLRCLQYGDVPTRICVERRILDEVLHVAEHEVHTLASVPLLASRPVQVGRIRARKRIVGAAGEDSEHLAHHSPRRGGLLFPPQVLHGPG